MGYCILWNENSTTVRSHPKMFETVPPCSSTVTRLSHFRSIVDVAPFRCLSSFQLNSTQLNSQSIQSFTLCPLLVGTVLFQWRLICRTRSTSTIRSCCSCAGCRECFLLDWCCRGRRSRCCRWYFLGQVDGWTHHPTNGHELFPYQIRRDTAIQFDDWYVLLS